MIEMWENIAEFGGDYQVSNLGNVRSSLHGILRPGLNKGGYFHVSIREKTLKIHRLVAFAFMPNPNNYLCVNHKNGIKKDNRVENLEWCTHSQNTIHAFDNGLRKKITGLDNYISKVILHVETGVYYYSITDAAKFSRYSIWTLYRVFKGTSSANTGLIIT